MFIKRLLLALCLIFSVGVQSKDTFHVCWSHYTGWEPWHYIQESGVLKRWADKYGIDVQLEREEDYLGSITRYIAGDFDACTMTHLDALALPAAQGVDSTVLIIGDYSNGNDGIISRSAVNVSDLKGKTVALVKFSVSHYLLDRALALNGLTERDITIKNITENQIEEYFINTPDANVVTWNPILQRALSVGDANMLFDSSSISGEILDVMLVKTDADERLKKVLVGAWYETMALLEQRDEDVLISLSESAGVSVEDFLVQLDTTYMLYTPESAIFQAESDALIITMDYVRSFSFDHGLFGVGEWSKNIVGILFPKGEQLGGNKIKLRFSSEYIRMAQSGEL